jgi:hypothetical protein
MKSFDQFEFTGILVPGVIALYGLARMFPNTVGFVGDKGISVGDLGLFVVLAYAAGHLVQAIGNLIEVIFWRIRGGMPTDWVRNKDRTYLSTEQTPALEERVSLLYPNAPIKTIADRSEKDWGGLTKQIYAIVQAAGRTRRVDIFNGNYGMFRGIAAALIVCMAGAAFSEYSTPGYLILFGALAVLALFRMNRFAIHYARELFIQFVSLDTSTFQKGKP